MSQYIQVGAVDTATQIEAAYKKVIADNPDFLLKWKKQCASYGFSPATAGVGWDDQCMAHEYANKLGIFAEKKPVSSSMLLLGGLAVLAVGYLIIKGEKK